MLLHHSLLLCLWHFLAFAKGLSTERDDAKCVDLARRVLGKNSMEFLLIPDANDLNTFVTSRVSVTFDWKHIDVLLNKSCVVQYLVEYGPYKYERSKRESVSSSSQISRPLSAKDTTSFKARLPDDCQVYSAHLIAVLGDGKVMVESKRRRFWPAAHRTSIESFSDAIVLSWPPICSYMTKPWSLQVCHGERQCSKIDLEGESPLHLAHLQSCALHQISIFPYQSDDEADIQRNGDNEPLWSFPDVKTLPKPNFDVVAGHDNLHIKIRQSNCDPEALVAHWRVTHCNHVPKRTTATVESEEEEDDGSGYTDGDDTETDNGDYYYYEHREVSAQSCVNGQYQVSKDGTLLAAIKGLDSCTLYSIDITPTNERGETLQPGEQYGTIHSTLCNEMESEGGSRAFWFEEKKHGSQGKND